MGASAICQPVHVEAHELEVADLAVRPLKSGPGVLPVRAVDAAAPFCSVITGNRRG